MSTNHQNAVNNPITAGHTSSISGEHNGEDGGSNNTPATEPNTE